MKRNEEIKNLFLKKIKTVPVDVINISSMCDELKIKRQTFYYYYRDIYDLVDDILTDYKEDFFIEKFDIYYVRKMLFFINENFVFFKSCINSNLQDLITGFLRDLLYNYVYELVSNNPSSSNLNNDELKEISNYHSRALSMLLADKISSNNELDSDAVLNKMQIFVSMEVISHNCISYFTNRRKI